MALQLARQVMSLDPRFAAAYGVALACYSQRFDQGLDFDDVQIAEGADSDEDAQAFRFDGALDSDMMSPRTGASLAGDWWHR